MLHANRSLKQLLVCDLLQTTYDKDSVPRANFEVSLYGKIIIIRLLALSISITTAYFPLFILYQSWT